MYLLARLAPAVWLPLCLLAGAQGLPPSPTAQEMIEQLKVKPPAARTRSLRNLTVEPADEAQSGQAATARPSLSLLIQFDFDSARVRSESHHALEDLARALKSAELASSRFAIEGHTDARGSPDHNRKLSERRAEAVRDVLAHEGVAMARLVASGKGSSEPANPADPRAAENRRVRIVNLD